MLYLNVKGLKDPTVGNPAVHKVNSHQKIIESHVVPGHGITSMELL